MAQSTIVVPPDSTGKSLATDTRVDTAHMQDFVLYGPDGAVISTLTANPTGTEKAIVTRSLIQGALQPRVTGNIVAATTVIDGTSDVTTANNTSVIISGTHAGVNISFEASDDSGTTWLPIAGVRDDSGIAESSSGVLVANQARVWNFGLFGFNRFRVRATAWTSGSAAIIIDYGTMPFEPLVSNVMSIPNRTALVLATATAGVIPAATEALATLAQCQRGFVGLASASSFALTAGRIFRIQAFTLGVRCSTTTAVTATAVIRFNPTGAVTATSPVVATLTVSTPAAIANEGSQMTISFPDGKDLPAGVTPGQVGVSLLGSTATGLAVISVEGFEYG
jgi:hypothetical protein